MIVPTTLESYGKWVRMFGGDNLPPEYEKIRYERSRFSRYYPHNLNEDINKFISQYEKKHGIKKWKY